MTPETPLALESGRALFNATKFFEAHEVWETAWRREQGDDKALLQGLIMVAAAGVKAGRDEPRGTVKLLRAARERLAGFAPNQGGLDVEALRGQVTTLLAAAEAWERGIGPRVEPAFSLQRA
jgi:predicted metal-dependent hydrolase